MADMPDHMVAIFRDLIVEAKRPDLTGKLKTADLHADIKQDQINKLKQLSHIPKDVVEMPGGGFISRFKYENGFLLCVQVSGFSRTELEEVEKCLAEFKALPEDMDESTFMFLSLKLQKFYKIKDEFLNFTAATDNVAMADLPEYSGHEIADLIEIFENIQIYTIPTDSLLANRNKWFVAAHITSSCSAFRSKSFPETTARKLNSLLLLGNSNPEHIFYASTSIHLRQCFMEVYRGLETLFYLPWIDSLKKTLNYTGSGRSLAGDLRKSIGWRQKESESIRRLFLIAQKPKVFNAQLKALPAFGDLNFDEIGADSIGRRIYKIRNILVHQEDYDDTSKIDLTQDCWPTLVEYLLEISIDLYSRYPTDADFSFDTLDTPA